MMRRLFHPLGSTDTYRALLFQVVQLGIGVVAFTLLVAGWTITLVFAITPLVVPLLIVLRAAVGLLARTQAYVAEYLLGVRARPPASAEGRGFWDRGFAVFRQRSFWRQQAHLLLAWPIALVPLSLLSWGLQLLTLPVWYRWGDSEDVFGFMSVDSALEALPFSAVGLVVVVGVAHLLGPLTALARRLATWALADDGAAVVRSPEWTRAELVRALTITSLVATSIVVLLIVIWGLTPGEYFWPIWPLLSLALLLGIPGVVLLVDEHPAAVRLAGGSKALAIQIGVSAVLFGFLVAVWAITTHGYFWPIWPALALALLVVIHAAVVYASHHHRIEVLEASRAGAVDVQETELRRIERDLHDGAQARLVALGMSLGMAEQQLETDPEAARALLAEARAGAAEALGGAPRPRARDPPADPHRSRARGCPGCPRRQEPRPRVARRRRRRTARARGRDRRLLHRRRGARERDQARPRGARRHPHPARHRVARCGGRRRRRGRSGSVRARPDRAPPASRGA